MKDTMHIIKSLIIIYGYQNNIMIAGTDLNKVMSFNLFGLYYFLNKKLYNFLLIGFQQQQKLTTYALDKFQYIKLTLYIYLILDQFQFLRLNQV